MKTRNQVNFAIHKQMEIHFGEKSCEASHKWLSDNFSVHHVSDLTQQQADKALSRLRSKPMKVRKRTWDLLSPGTRTPVIVQHKPKFYVPMELEPRTPISKERRETAKQLLTGSICKHGYELPPGLTIKTENDNYGMFYMKVSLTPNGLNLAQLICSHQISDIHQVRPRFNSVIRMVNMAINLPLPQFITECQNTAYLKRFDYRQLIGTWETIQKELGGLPLKGPVQVHQMQEAFRE